MKPLFEFYSERNTKMFKKFLVFISLKSNNSEHIIKTWFAKVQSIFLPQQISGIKIDKVIRYNSKMKTIKNIRLFALM